MCRHRFTRHLAGAETVLYMGVMQTALIAMGALPQDFHEGLENLLEIVGKGDNMPIAGLIPIIMFFTWLALREAFRHDRLIAQGREDEVLDQMYK
jgi:hypothetical protein